MTKQYYRYEIHVSSGWSINHDGDLTSLTIGETKIYLTTYDVIKETPKGVFIDVYGERKFINKEWRKRFAAESPEEALKSFVARKARERSIYQARLRSLERVFDLIEPEKTRLYLESVV